MRVQILLSFLTFVSLGCDESLPPRTEPVSVVQVKLTRVHPLTQEIIPEDKIFYDTTRPQNWLTFGFRMTNLYDDPLDGSAYIIAHYTLTPVDSPQYAIVKTIVDTSSGRTLHIDPGKTKCITFAWDFRLPTHEPKDTFYQVYHRDDGLYKFTLEGDIQVFKSVAVQRPSLYSFVLSVHR